MATIVLGALAAFVLYIPIPFVVKEVMRRKSLATVRKTGNVYLTFDDGPDPEATPAILDLLRQNGAKAAFFMLGESVAKYPNIVKHIIAEGHEIGEHSYGHTHPWKGSPLRSAVDLIKGGHALQQHPRPASASYFRPPFGKLNLVTLLYVWLTKKKVVFWNVDPRDYDPASSAETVARFAMDRLDAGSIILLHDGRRGPDRSRPPSPSPPSS
jgi:peptidoglycan/xylan/chitin deacetylase (PgdA/CDA1 family)